LIKELEAKHGDAIDYACSWSCSEAINRLSLLEKWKNAATQAAREIAASINRKIFDWDHGTNPGSLAIARIKCLRCGHVLMQDDTLPVPEKCHHCGYDFKAGIS
jgi:predicted Zn-ribbon and HTH transcriptional regulator